MPGFLNLKRPGTAEAIEAINLVNGDRQQQYGSPAINWGGIADVWNGFLVNHLKPGVRITAEQAALMMTGAKVQRQFMKRKRDNIVDAHGYLVVSSHCPPPEETCPTKPRRRNRRRK